MIEVNRMLEVEKRRNRDKHVRSHRLIFMMAICLLSLGLPGRLTFGAGPESQEEFSFSWMQDPVVYLREGRSDPFLPFLPEKLVHVEVPQEELTGMRRFEPGQLSLVTVVLTETDRMAMVQDSVGRGYILREGSKIGRTGVVEQIIANKVRIKQQMLTTSGEIRLQTVEMVLRKEGEK
jgi:hypothetical protein